jgi:hypothetical protein
MMTGPITVHMSETPDANQLLRYYRRYIGNPDRAVDVYAGFSLFFIGLGLGAVSVVVFLYSATLPAGSTSSFAIREVAGVATATGFPALLFGIVVLLPVDKRMVYIAAGGSLINAIAVGLFVWAYPQDWNVTMPPDYSAQIITVYSVGIALVVSATGAALVAHQVERAVGGTNSETDAEDAATEKNISDEQIQADIDRALDDAELSFGGTKRTETRRLNLNTSAIDDIDTENLADSGTETRTNDDNIADAVAQLQGLQGGNVETASGESTDDQANALRELREQQRNQQAQQATKSGLMERIRGWF